MYMMRVFVADIGRQASRASRIGKSVLGLPRKPWCMFAGERIWDRGACAALLESLPLAVMTRAQLEEQLTRRFGTWIVVNPRGELQAATTLAALVAWDALLRRVVEVFEEADVFDEIETRVEYAAGGLVPIIAELTRCDDAWYQELAHLLTWYCEHAGIASEVAEPIVDVATAGVFQSWIEPEDETLTQGAAAIGQAVANGVDAGHDALEVWLRNRAWAAGYPVPAVEPEAVEDDPHARFIAGAESARDSQRADRMAIALDACRQSAIAGEPLTFDRLKLWQQIVLDDPAIGFRESAAFAKAGRERYGLFADIAVHFDEALRGASSGEPLLLRAARVYLDVSYFHPFRDGNGRAARLALDHVLTRAGHGLHAIEPLIRISWAVHERALAHCTSLLAQLVGPCAWLRVSPAMVR
jgi:hypothetical protein